jgi:hypothetical protein
VLSKFKKLEAAAKSLRTEFNAIPDHGSFTPQEIYWAFLARRRRPPREGEEFQFLEEMLGAVIKFSEYAMQRLQQQDPEQPNDWRARSESDVWNIWVNAITKIVKRNDLPYKVRKDRDKNKNDVPSAFVVFVRELQKRLPVQCRKFMHSEDALAQGIHRARHEGTVD